MHSVSWRVGRQGREGPACVDEGLSFSHQSPSLTLLPWEQAGDRWARTLVARE